MGLTILDAGVVIGALDASDQHHTAAVDAIRAAQARGDRLGVPASAYAEALVHPLRRSSRDGDTVDAFLDSLPATVHATDRSIGRLAAQLRADHGNRLRLPDALVLATAISLSADVVVTTDRGWPAEAVPVTVLMA